MQQKSAERRFYKVELCYGKVEWRIRTHQIEQFLSFVGYVGGLQYFNKSFSSPAADLLSGISVCF